MRYSILGSTLLSGAPVGPRQVRIVLAALLSRPSQPVTVETLAGELWQGRVPESSGAVLQGRISTLRRLLCPGVPARSPNQAIHTRHGCYTLRVSDGELDAAEFLKLSDAAGRAADQGDLENAGRLFREGLGLWRGAALQDTGRGPLLSGFAGLLEQRRVAALERLYELDIELGRPHEAISGLTQQLTADPTQENFAALLVEALVAAGRVVAARDVFDRTLATLADAGLCPSPRLELAGTLLRPDDAPPTPLTPCSGPAQVPAQLADFTGRGALLEQIRQALTGYGPRLVVLSGPGGIGKSTLAVRVAHLMRREFPSGQFVADLTTEPVRPAEVLRRFLIALGIAEADVPGGFVERQQLWRSRTADARALVLLDDARDEAQVRALLPAGPSCGVLVTSRRRMLGLAGAATVPVSAFDDDEARQLLVRIIGRQRVEAEPVATRRLLRLCAGLPLAVRIVGAKLAARPHETVEELVSRLRVGRGRLSEMRAGDLDVRATLELSYAECTPQARKALRLLGAARLPTVSGAVVGHLLGESADVGGEVAEALVEAQLSQVAGRDSFGRVRYQLHDLIAEFSAEKAASEEPSDVVDAALTRLHEAYLDAATGAARADPSRWCLTEARNVVATMRIAVRRHWWDRALELADAFAELIRVCPGVDSARHVTVLAVWAARRAGRLRDEGANLRRLAELHWQELKVGNAARYLAAAADRFRDVGDRVEWARTLVAESDVLVETGRAAVARERLHTAIDVARDAGADRVRAAALDQLGGVLSDAGEFGEAERCFLTALRLSRAGEDDRAVACAAKRLADVLRRAGRYERATELLAESLSTSRRLGDIHWEAHSLRSLGEVQRYTGHTEDARRSLRRSLRLFADHGHRHAAAYALRSLADLHAQVHEFDEAGEALTRCREVFESLGDRRGQAYTLRSLGALFARTNRWAEAERALRAALEIFDALSMRWFSHDVTRALAQTRGRLARH